jgi:hypothetical protein
MKILSCILLHSLTLTVCLVSQSAVIHVPEDYPTIQEGIDAAVSGDTVLVASGTYRGPNNRNLEFKGKAITVASLNGPEWTIIDCEEQDRAFYFHLGEGPNSVLRGFTITGGRPPSSSDSGGAIYCESSPTIEDNIIKGNIAAKRGGAIWCTIGSSVKILNNLVTENTAYSGGGICCDRHSSPTIVGNTIFQNKGRTGGGIYCGGKGFSELERTSPIIRNNFIGNNSADDGGGLHFYNCTWDSNPIVENNEITGNIAKNMGGGIFCDRYSFSPRIAGNTISDNSAIKGGGISFGPMIAFPIIHDNKIIGNSAYDGGGIYCAYEHSDQPRVSMCNNVIAKNTAHNGGGLYADKGLLEIISNTIVGNSGEQGGGVYCPDAVVTFANTILWSNNPRQIHGTPGVTHTNIQGGWPGIGNISAEPGFVDEWNDDYHLKYDSPCIGAGIMWNEVPGIDIEGNPRPNPYSSEPDIGAYESPSAEPRAFVRTEIINLFSDKFRYPRISMEIAKNGASSEVEIVVYKNVDIPIIKVELVAEEVAGSSKPGAVRFEYKINSIDKPTDPKDDSGWTEIERDNYPSWRTEWVIDPSHELANLEASTLVYVRARAQEKGTDNQDSYMDNTSYVPFVALIFEESIEPQCIIDQIELYGESIGDLNKVQTIPRGLLKLLPKITDARVSEMSHTGAMEQPDSSTALIMTQIGNDTDLSDGAYISPYEKTILRALTADPDIRKVRFQYYSWLENDQFADWRDIVPDVDVIEGTAETIWDSASFLSPLDGFCLRCIPVQGAEDYDPRLSPITHLAFMMDDKNASGIKKVEFFYKPYDKPGWDGNNLNWRLASSDYEPPFEAKWDIADTVTIPSGKYHLLMIATDHATNASANVWDSLDNLKDRARVIEIVEEMAQPEISRLRISPSEVTLSIGGSQMLWLTAYNDEGKPVEISRSLVTWSMSNNIGQIYSDGVFNAEEAGSATIKVSLNSDPTIVSQSVVTVKPSLPEKLVVYQPTSDIMIGGEYQLTVLGTDALGNSVLLKSEEIEWSVTEGTGTITPAGIFTPFESGTVKVQITLKANPDVKTVSEFLVIQPDKAVDSSQKLETSWGKTKIPPDMTSCNLLPGFSALRQNYPNPFNPETWIPYQLSADADVVIRIYNLSGRLIKALDLGYKLAGFYTDKENAAYWNGKDEMGEQASSGIFFYNIQAGELAATGKMIIAR